jgi:hypothetical protein
MVIAKALLGAISHSLTPTVPAKVYRELKKLRVVARIADFAHAIDQATK